jgi:DNA modification methylase
MFSFAGDTVVDPFAGTGTTALAAIDAGRNSISVELEPSYVGLIDRRLRKQQRLGAHVDIRRRMSEYEDVSALP